MIHSYVLVVHKKKLTLRYTSFWTLKSVKTRKRWKYGKTNFLNKVFFPKKAIVPYENMVNCLEITALRHLKRIINLFLTKEFIEK